MENSKKFFNIILFWILSISLNIIIIPLFVGKIILSNLSVIGLTPLHSYNYQSFIIISIVIFLVLVFLNKYFFKQKVFYLSNIALNKKIPIYIFIVISVIGLLYSIFNINFRFNNETYKHIIISVEAGMFEEYLFRGIILISLIKYFINFRKINEYKSIILGIFISSLMFALTHFINLIGQILNSETEINAIVQVICTFFLGIICAVIYLRTRSIIYPMFFHFCFDFSSFFIKNSLTYIDSFHNMLIYILGFFIISFILMFLFIKPNNSKYICSDFHISN